MAQRLAAEGFLVVLPHPTCATPRHFFETLKSGLDYILGEARQARAARMMSVGIHARWSGQAADFAEDGLAQEGVRFMGRIDIAEDWVSSFAPA